VGNLARHWL